MGERLVWVTTESEPRNPSPSASTLSKAWHGFQASCISYDEHKIFAEKNTVLDKDVIAFFPLPFPPRRKNRKRCLDCWCRIWRPNLGFCLMWSGMERDEELLHKNYPRHKKTSYTPLASASRTQMTPPMSYRRMCPGFSNPRRRRIPYTPHKSFYLFMHPASAPPTAPQRRSQRRAADGFVAPCVPSSLEFQDKK